MTWLARLEHRFVDRIPRSLEPGVLYVSMEYATAAHSCACGCGQEVMTPITPTDWSLTFDGESVSLWPSIGNWQLTCRSHYIIEQGRIIRSRAWTQWQIGDEQRRDKVAKARHYGTSKNVEGAPMAHADRGAVTEPRLAAPRSTAAPTDVTVRPKRTLWEKFFRPD